jgi:hypothetical protein
MRMGWVRLESRLWDWWTAGILTDNEVVKPRCYTYLIAAPAAVRAEPANNNDNGLQ